MKSLRTICIGSVVLAAAVLLAHSGKAAAAAGSEKAPNIVSLQKPEQGLMEIIFRGNAGPFRIQTRASANSSAAWVDIPEATVTEIEAGIFMGLFPKGESNLALYRVVSESDGINELRGWTILASVSAPANGLYFVKGESPVVTVTILDNFAQGLSRADFSSLNLYLYGPQDPKQTVTAVKLLNASTDRTKTPHHYIDLRSNPDVKVNGTRLIYTLRPITDEPPGTYTVSVWSVLASDPMQQLMKFSNVQIGTSDVETPVVGKAKCAVCHEGPISGKMYMHHIDPSRSPTGSWGLDLEPTRSCKACHNNDGYAAYTDASAPGGRVSDAIVRRVHGVHMGDHLKLPFNIDPDKGDFKDYVHVEFPANVNNCTACHVDDRWKTEPSRLACGTCHDNRWFGDKAALPAGMEAHKGGTQLNDKKCWQCHDAGGPDDMGIARSVTDGHTVTTPAFKQVVKLEMTPPANGKFYVAGESPAVIIKITDAATGQVVNPNTIVEPVVSTNLTANEWSRANLFVSGPRSDTEPVLTTAAAKRDPARSYANNELRVLRDKSKEDLRITRTADSIRYQLDNVATLAPGTYTVFVDVSPNIPLGGWAYLNFQVGTATPELMVAANCTDCHGDSRMHTSSRAVTFTPDICKSCHDNLHQMTGKTSWLTSQYGFGVAPLSRRVHGIHFGNYVEKPTEIHRTDDFSHVIFPQDVRNCTKCHSQSSSWTEKPSRLACLACHDSDYAGFHASLMTLDFTPKDPWSGDEVETCIVCHGKGSEFAPKAVHAISQPYVPPYPRATRE